MLHTIGSEGPCRRIHPSGAAKQQSTYIYRRMESSPEEATQETISTRRLLRAIRACTRDSPPSLAPLSPPPRDFPVSILGFLFNNGCGGHVASVSRRWSASWFPGWWFACSSCGCAWPVITQMCFLHDAIGPEETRNVLHTIGSRLAYPEIRD